ncbi:hypothetical protein NEILACOT_04342 [Neisseria lactamica ATCC 23970]|uniref:Uncharacterized protein n=1 Tax=Neisseria lactamica ATCC 23970 TaxID=546265 RepID=D0W9X9_NEILA|nr:hypothetical protein NEILACOT_04342 [Neisseria lactamica ATCC 23970]
MKGRAEHWRPVRARDLPAKWQKRFFATKIYVLYFSDRVRKWKYGIF